jgi:hydroxymethylbilane synthase
VADLPSGAVIATSSTRRREQILALRPDLRVVEIRGNVGTRLQKLADRSDFDATLLAAAGLARLGFRIEADGLLLGPPGGPGGLSLTSAVPDGVLAVLLPVEEVLPCVGQAAIGLEVRAGDERLATVCARLNHEATFQCVTAERSFLHALGGGCQSPVAAFAEVTPGRLVLRGVSFRSGPARQAKVTGSPGDAVRLGEELAAQLR